MDEDELPDGEPVPASFYPTKAKDMFDVGGEIIRDLLENGCFDDLYETYGIKPDEATLSLHCAEIASWPWWDLDALVEAATVYQVSQLKLYEGSEGCEAEIANISNGIARIKRRIHLASKEPNFPGALQAAEAVMFLERLDIHVFHELREAVIYRQAGRAENQDELNRLRRLLGKEVVDAESTTLPETAAKGDKSSVEDTSAKVRIKMRDQEDAIIDWLNANGYTPKALPKVKNGLPTARAAARKVLDKRYPFDAKTAFDAAWQRLRGLEQIGGETE